MSKKLDEIYEIKRLLSLWYADIKCSNALKYYDINRIAEDLALNLLNSIYNFKLVNANEILANHDTLDLAYEDITDGIAFQVTSRTDSAKIHDTLLAFKSKNYILKYPKGIKFFIIRLDGLPKTRSKFDPSFNKKKDIYTLTTIYNDIYKLYGKDRNKFYDVKSILTDEYGEASKKRLTDAEILKTYEQCFLRPAFINKFQDEVFIPNFEIDFPKAISDTLEALVTGNYSNRNGRLIELIPPVTEIKDQHIKFEMLRIVKLLSELKTAFYYITNKDSGHSKLVNKTLVSDEIGQNIMNSRRSEILHIYKSIYKDFNLQLIQY